MKAIIEFDLNEPDDVDAHKRATKSLDMALCLFNIEEMLRKKIKYSPMSKPARKEMEKVLQEFYDISYEHHIFINELIK